MSARAKLCRHLVAALVFATLVDFGCSNNNRPKVIAGATLHTVKSESGQRATGAEYLPLDRSLTSRTPILTYHDVVAERDSSAVWFDVTTSELSQQLDWLAARGARFVTIDALYSHLTRGTALPRGAIAITFADNYEGFFLRGLPVLRAKHIPIAMFVHTDFVGDSAHGRPKMSWPQLLELDREGLVTICSQTMSHPADLRNLTNAALANEMAGSKRELERRLGHEIPFLAYPNGMHDARVEAAARTAGYVAAFSEGMRPAERSESILAIDRYVHTRYKQAWRDSGR